MFDPLKHIAITATPIERWTLPRIKHFNEHFLTHVRLTHSISSVNANANGWRMGNLRIDDKSDCPKIHLDAFNWKKVRNVHRLTSIDVVDSISDQRFIEIELKATLFSDVNNKMRKIKIFTVCEVWVFTAADHLNENNNI